MKTWLPFGLNERSSFFGREDDHHQKISFRDEFIEFLKVNAIESDERFI